MNGLIFACGMHMHHNYQQFDLQTLIDLLAVETERYTETFTSGGSSHNVEHRVSIDALVEEILIRKRALISNADQPGLKTKDDFPCC